MAYCAFMLGRLTTLEKYLGLYPVGVWEKWQRLFAKTVLKVTGPEATMAYQDYQLCDILKAGIYCAFHGVKYIWDEN